MRAWLLPGGSRRQASGEKCGKPSKAPGGSTLVPGSSPASCREPAATGSPWRCRPYTHDGPDWPAIALRAHVTIPYDPAFKSRLFPLFDPQTARLDEVCRLNVALAEKFAEAVEACARQAGLSLSDLDLIGSHGQTICHLPPQAERKVAGGVPSTLQIGDVSVLAERTGVTAVGNFRLRDMAAGGEGRAAGADLRLAPLSLARKDSHRAKHWRHRQHDGAASGAGLDEVFACDTGPGNMLIDEAVRYDHPRA